MRNALKILKKARCKIEGSYNLTKTELCGSISIIILVDVRTPADILQIYFRAENEVRYVGEI